MKAILFDTETTGMDEPQLIEAAWSFVPDIITPAMGVDVHQQRFTPSKPIEFGAMATHHITEEDLVDCPPHDSFSIPDGVQYIIGHNIDYDWEVIGCPGVRRIDTLALCRHLWPDTDSHKQTAMLYMLDRTFAMCYAREAHSAAIDVFMLSNLLAHIVAKISPDIKEMSVEMLWKFSEMARIPRTMPFGKHKGERLVDVPVSYRCWLLGQSDIDPYLRKAMEAL